MDFIHPESSKEEFSFSFPEITKNWSFDLFNNYGNYISHNRKGLTNESNIKTFIKDSHKHAVYALLAIFTLSPDQFPADVIEFYQLTCSQFKEWNIPIPENLLAPMIMRYAQAAVKQNKAKDLISDFSKYLEKKPDLYVAPYLYLTASLGEPERIEFKISSKVRLASIQLYYLGLNLLELGNIQDAESVFLHSWSLSSKCKEIRIPIITYLGLIQFLLGKSFTVFKSIVPDAIRVPQEIIDLYDIDKTGYNPSATFHPWEKAIFNERAKRIIVDIAHSYTHISREELKSRCPRANFETALSMSFDYISGNENDGILYFDPPTLTTKLQKEIDSVKSELLPYIQSQ